MTDMHWSEVALRALKKKGFKYAIRLNACDEMNKPVGFHSLKELEKLDRLKHLDEYLKYQGIEEWCCHEFLIGEQYYHSIERLLYARLEGKRYKKIPANVEAYIEREKHPRAIGWFCALEEIPNLEETL